jgi:hypothetical protein
VILSICIFYLIIIRCGDIIHKVLRKRLDSHISLSIMAIKYPATIFIYLSKFPARGRWKQVLYILFWVLLYGINEIIDVFGNNINYYNGWNLGWSLFFNAVAFIILRIHYSKPLLAWMSSIGFIIFLWNMFDVPLTVFR